MALIRILSLTLLLSLSALTVNSAADDDGTVTYEVTDEEITITGCVGTCPRSLEIPSAINDLPVTTIGERAFLAKVPSKCDDSTICH